GDPAPRAARHRGGLHHPGVGVHAGPVHFNVRPDPAGPPRDGDGESINEKLSDATRLWDDDFRLVLERKLGEEQEKYLYNRYVEAYPQTYKDEHTPYE